VSAARRALASAAPRALLLANPHGGRGHGPRVAESARRRLEAAGWSVELVLTRYAGHGAELAAALPPGELDALCVVGGDGSLREVLDGLLAGRRASTQGVCLVPSGTGNALAAELELAGPGDAIERLLASSQRLIDVLRVETGAGVSHHACDLLGLGLAADAARWAEHLRWLGRPRYAVGSALAALVEPSRNMRVVFDDGADVFEGPVDLLIGSNTRHTGAGMLVAPEARLDDGLMDVLLVRGMSRARRCLLLPRLGRGELGGVPELLTRRVRSLEVELREELLVNLDGDLLPAGRLRAEVLPRALRLLA